MNFVLALTGPAGSGKSTVASKLAKQLKKTINIEADQVKHFIVSGFSYYKTPEGIKKWDFNEWELLGDSIGLLADNFVKTGYSVIINGYINEPAWEHIEGKIGLTHKVLLLPKLEVVIKRDAERVGDAVMGSEDVNEHYDYFINSSFYDDFIKLDTSNQSLDKTVGEVAELLGRRDS